MSSKGTAEQLEPASSWQPRASKARVMIVSALGNMMKKRDELRISAVLVHRQWAFFHNGRTFSRWYDQVGVSEMGIDASKDWYDPRTQAGTVLTPYLGQAYSEPWDGTSLYPLILSSRCSLFTSSSRYRLVHCS